MKRYLMFRKGGRPVCVVEDGEVVRDLPHVVQHSPDGFEWGYGGSGPAELARCLLLDAVGLELADMVHQDFKWEVIASMPFEGGAVTFPQVVDFMQRQYGARRWLEGFGVREEGKPQ